MGSSANGGGGGVPPGFRFHPTDEELLHYYLKKKILFEKFDMEVVREVDLNKTEPWDLQERCKIGSTPQNEWYFFSHKDRKYPTGSRTNRATNAGFWKATGRDKCIKNTFKKIGMRKTLVFYRGRAPHGQKTDWIMHEYRLEDSDDPEGNVSEDGWVVCRVFKKKNLFKVGNEGTGGADHINNGSTSQSRALTHRDNSYMLHQYPHHSLSYSHNPLPIIPQYSSQIQVQNFMPTHKALTYDHFINMPSESPIMVKQLMTNTRDCESGSENLRYQACESGLEVGTCDVNGAREENINDWGMLVNTQLGVDDSSKGGRFEDPGTSSMNQINQLSLRGEMNFWGYDK
ncbi:hypothetical protein Leryth_004461 [Lithospermum erythrorhizon]|nr:hypothetical protein Leryth_004461 [Lithospermum erythrorhizon]